jgi:hypothetical protein
MPRGRTTRTCPFSTKTIGSDSELGMRSVRGLGSVSSWSGVSVVSLATTARRDRYPSIFVVS